MPPFGFLGITSNPPPAFPLLPIPIDPQTKRMSYKKETKGIYKK